MPGYVRKIYKYSLPGIPVTFLDINHYFSSEKSTTRNVLPFISEKRHTIHIGAVRPYKKLAVATSLGYARNIYKCSLLAISVIFSVRYHYSLSEKSTSRKVLPFISEKRHTIHIGAVRPYKKLAVATSRGMLETYINAVSLRFQ